MRALWLALVAGCVATITDVQSPLGETIAKAMGVCADPLAALFLPVPHIY